MAKIVVDMDEVFELEEAAQFLEVSIATLFRWMRKGKVIPLRIGGRTYIIKRELERVKRIEVTK